jgi:hypothetical protein
VLRAGAMVAAACLAFGGCATKAPPYQSSIENVQTLQRLAPEAKVSIGTVRADDKSADALDRITARTTSIDSPYGTYAEYLKEALRADLAAAGRLDPKAARSVNATLMRNRLDASGVNVGEAEVAARFTVTEGAKVLYDKQHSASHTWDSSFLGNLAAMRAVQNYSVVFQKLLKTLFADPDFGNAIGK